MKPKTKKQIETEKWVDEYIEKFNYPPTYQQIQNHFKIDASAAHFRCRNFRDKMRKNNVPPLSTIKYTRVTIGFLVADDKTEKFYKLINQIHKILKNEN
jgi:hypothetical protein